MRDSGMVACVTGGTGLIGRRIVERLLDTGYSVRMLSRRSHLDDPRVELHTGSLGDEEALRRFVAGADMLFHCAGEIHDESRMWDVNVLGTQRLLRALDGSGVCYLCYLSSAGVVGKTRARWVDEQTECEPINAYEKSKWAAEQAVSKGVEGCSVVMLRPTNVIGESKPGKLFPGISPTWISKLKVFVRGGGAAYIVHADDVAAAAMFFISREIKKPECYFVSLDHEELNTVAGLWSLCRAIQNNVPVGEVRPVPHLPVIVPHIIRLIRYGKSNPGYVRYSSGKLLGTGFKFPLGFEGAVRKIMSEKSAEPA